MRILIYGINYSPEVTGVGKYTGEMAKWLAARGHEVLVVTAPPYYPEWQIRNGFSGWCYQKECSNGLKVFRCPLWVPKNLNGLKRVVHLLSFAASSMPVLLSKVKRPHLVLNISPTLFTAPGALWAARLSGAKAWLHIHDFEADISFELGILRVTALRRMVVSVESLIIRHFDCVSTISKRMMENLWKKGVPKSRTVLFPNWVDTEAIYPFDEPYPNPMRSKLQIDSDTIVALYSGSMGQKQGIEILLEVAKNLESHPKIKFVLCGEGPIFNKVESMASNLRNVLCLPLQPVEKLNHLLNLADIHLLPQRNGAADFAMPSKLTGILASGKPVVAAASADTQLSKLADTCGIVVRPGDAQAFAEGLLWLAGHPQERRKLGKTGRALAIKELNKEKVLSEFESDLGGFAEY